MAVQLGTIKWNFSQLRMKFKHQGKVHILKGVNARKTQLIAHEQLPRVLKSVAPICMLPLFPESVQLWGLEGDSSEQPPGEL